MTDRKETTMSTLDERFNRLPDEERCPVCGAPDNCGDCDHTPLSDEDAALLNGAPTITITIVPDSPCPDCGAAWGHPDPTLDFPNRPKVGGDNGVWWWRCYNPACDRDYYIPLL